MSPVHEFVNFVTHQERDRGHIYDYPFQTRQQLVQLSEGQAYAFTIKLVYAGVQQVSLQTIERYYLDLECKPSKKAK